jgi:hypothetical protein
MDSFLTRSAKKLEQALRVPRPWELTPATSIGYQMATGEGSIGERARKGAAQFIGRYATNIKEPYGYDVPKFNLIESAKSVLKDEPKWIPYGISNRPWFGEGGARETLYREMFDLPPRTMAGSLEKTGTKEYRLKDFEEPRPKPLISPYKHNVYNPLLANVALSPTEGGTYRYEDVWDIVSPSDVERTDISARLRKLIAPILRPATVSGEVPAP